MSGARPAVTAAHATFIPLNARHGRICTRWQIKPMPADALALNDHTDLRWDNTVVRDLTDLPRDAIRATSCGSSFTKISWPLWVSPGGLTLISDHSQ